MKIQLTISILFLTVFSYAQKSKVLEGNYKSLKGVEVYNLVFDYSDVQIEGYNSEEEYLQEQMREMEKKEVGKGAKYRDEWFSDRAYRYEPRFVESFNEYFKKGEVKVVKNLIDSEYTMKVHTTYIYPGYHGGVVWKESKINAIIFVYKTKSPSEILLKVEVKGALGYYQGEKAVLRGFAYHVGERIGFSYWSLGKYFAKRFRMGIK